MTRKQILQEMFSDTEIEVINKYEPQLRGLIAKAVNKLDSTKPIADNDKISSAVDSLLLFIFDNNPPEGMSDRVQVELLDLFTDPKYAGSCDEIVNTIFKSRLGVESLRNSNFNLNDVCGKSEITKRFLLDLYNTTISIGGGNSIGKGELMFAACLSDVKLTVRATNSKSDLTTVKGVPVELKSDGGRLDGSGIRPTRFRIENMIELLDKALSINDCPDFNTARQKRQQQEYAVLVKDFNQLRTNLRQGGDWFIRLSNPFSRKSIDYFWYGSFLTWLETYATHCKALNIKVGLAKVLSDLIFSIYQDIYQDFDFGVEMKYVTTACDQLAEVILTTDDVERFVTWDTVIRARVYMRLTKDNEASDSAYLVFTKNTGSNVIAHCIDYTNGLKSVDFSGEFNQWNDKINSRKLHVTPGNDNVRASHAVHVRD